MSAAHHFSGAICQFLRLFAEGIRLAQVRDMDVDVPPSAPPSAPWPSENRSALQRAVLAYERASTARRPRRRRTLKLEAEWILLDQIEVRGARYVLARREMRERHVLARLTRREREVLEYLANGHTTKVAAYELGIADATVRVFLVRAIRKLGARTRSEALARYMEALQLQAPIAAE